VRTDRGIEHKENLSDEKDSQNIVNLSD